MSTVHDNVWTNNEGTIAVDKVTTGDVWLGYDHKIDHHHTHGNKEINQNVQRLASINRSIWDWHDKGIASPDGPPNSRTPSSVISGGFWYSPQGSSGGFRGLPKIVDTVRGKMAIIGYGPHGDGKAPAITQLIQGGWLPNKSKGDIEAEMRDFNRWRDAQTNFKGECRRC